MTPVTVIRGHGPIVLAQPHSGTYVPESIRSRLTDAAADLKDTDWRIPELYEGLLEDVTIVRANFNRYVVDANRSPDDEHLYPGQNTTSLVPVVTFDNQPVWKQAISAEDIEQRVADFHQPYHSALSAELERIKALHGAVILYDCHSIRSELPFLFHGELPALNIGTFDGAACHPLIRSTAAQVCAADSRFSSVVDGRFKGGWTTRHYGRPASNVHAIQMEIAQRSYLETETLPFHYHASNAAPLRKLLAHLLDALAELVSSQRILEN